MKETIKNHQNIVSKHMNQTINRFSPVYPKHIRMFHGLNMFAATLTLRRV